MSTKQAPGLKQLLLDIMGAAAAEQERNIEPIRLQEQGFRLDLIPIDADGHAWNIELFIEDHILEKVRRSTPMGLRLIDGEGEVWIRSKPDQQGRTFGFWERDDEQPMRLRPVTLDMVSV